MVLCSGAHSGEEMGPCLCLAGFTAEGVRMLRSRTGCLAEKALTHRTGSCSYIFS